MITLSQTLTIPKVEYKVDLNPHGKIYEIVNTDVLIFTVNYQRYNFYILVGSGNTG